MFRLSTLGNIEIDTEILLIPEFRLIYDSDKTKDKSTAFKKFAYIYFMSDYKSPYNNFGDKKEQSIINDFFRDTIIEPKADDITNAIKKYDELKKIPEVYVLESARTLMFKLAKYMETVEVTNRTALMASKALDNVAKTLSSYGLVKESVERELGKQGKKVGGTRKGNREN